MSDTTLQNPVPAVPLEIPPSTPAATPRPAFADSDGASRWAKTLPLLPVGQAHEALIGQLALLLSTQMPARDRAKITEIIRAQVSHLHTELARRYAGKPQPEGERECEAIDQAISVWHALWEQYSACLKPLIEGDPELAGVKAKILQRGLFVGKQLILVHGLARRAVPPETWQELHAYYRLAEMLDCSVTAVTDDLIPQGVGTSCYSTYSHALLLGLADPCAMTVRQIELADRWLGQWSRKLFPYARERQSESALVIVDLDSTAGARVLAATPKDAPAAFRFGYPGKLSTSVRGRLKRLAGGATPAEMQLGQDVSAEQCVALLSHLEARWCHVHRAQGEGVDAELELVSAGMLAAFFRVGGRTFERPDPIGRTFHGAQHLKTLGALTHYDRFREEAERDWPWERWSGRYESREATLRHADDTHYRWALDQLVVVRDGERMRLGWASRVVRSRNGEVALALKLWQGTPRALTLRPQNGAYSDEPPVPGLLLAETPEDRPSLVMQPRAFTPGRMLRSVDGGAERKFRLVKLLHRGADFERVAYEEA
ncbi:MAG TPA: hypothetical protein VFO33_09365 [Casimicrobiaceae bacterium]|nr:hypothetical protein [Casimicrobiaceae bacterium]